MRHHVEQWYPAGQGGKRTLKSQDWFLVPTPLNLAAHDWEVNRIEHQIVDQDDKIRHGPSVSYYPNGIRQSQGQYEYGERAGTFA
jgi:antitoxin component YwqK of YwqJK toxin-antitoxin module